MSNKMAIRINNYCENDILCISFPLIIGEVIAAQESKICIQNITAQSEPVVWPVLNGKFKVLVSLQHGKNKIRFEHRNSFLFLTLHYRYLESKRFVRLVYIKCKDDQGLFQAPIGENNSIQSACNRISLAGRMIQTFTLDKIKEHGLNGKTFKLEEENDNIICHVFTSSLSLNEAYKLKDLELWSHFAIELMNSKLRVGNNCKFLAFLSFTRYINTTNTVPQSHEEILSLTKGHLALGGGGLALFGSGCLHTWPENVQEIPWRFGDRRRIDKLQLMDDSSYRGWYWACYSTGLGAVLHELGHTFDLGHTRSGIMGRGFDDIYKYFIIDMFYYEHIFQKEYNPYYQKASNQNCTVPLSITSPTSWEKPLVKSLQNLQLLSESNEVPQKLPNPPDMFLENGKLAVNVGGAYWSRSSALLLYFHKWFNNYNEENKNTISFEGTKVLSLNGISVVEFRDRSNTSYHHLEFLGQNFHTEVDLASFQMSQYIPEGESEVSFIAEDRMGNIIKSKLDIKLFKID